jgi:hypothetical protein
MKRAKASAYSRMNTVELARATARFDREMVIDESSALTKADRDRWQRARRRPGRPRRGRGVRVISVSVERELLATSDKLARSLRISRARLIERGLKAVLEAEGISGTRRATGSTSERRNASARRKGR